MSEPSFEKLADVYEAMIDWPKRLANESPFFRRLFDQLDARSVLDAACGSGHHVNLFRSWGLRVEGADLSGEMIARCRSRWGESDEHRWSVRRFDQPVDTPALLDAAICVGNSLALAENLQGVADALRQMLGAIRVGGAVVVQVLNVQALPSGKPLWQKCVRKLLPQGQCLIIKGVHRDSQRGYVDLLVTKLSTEPPELLTQCVPFLPLEPAELETIARSIGCASVEFFGGYDRRPFDACSSQDLIMLVIK